MAKITRAKTKGKFDSRIHIKLSLPLEDPRRERFCQERAYGMSIERAYHAAGYAPNAGNAMRMNGYPEVQRRIDELKRERATLYYRAFEESVAKIGLEKADIAKMLIELKKDAQNNKQITAAVSCVKLLGEMIGAFTPTEKDDKSVSLEGMSGERLQKLLEAIDGRGEEASQAKDSGSVEMGVQSHFIS